MPQLPDFTALGKVEPTPDLNVARVQPSNIRMAGIPGSIMEQSGRELQQAGDIIQQTNLHFDGIAAEAGINQYHSQALTLQHDPQSGFANQHGQNAIGPRFYEDSMQRLHDQQQQIRDGLQNDQ